jgi:hypothetical protein
MCFRNFTHLILIQKMVGLSFKSEVVPTLTIRNCITQQCLERCRLDQAIPPGVSVNNCSGQTDRIGQLENVTLRCLPRTHETSPSRPDKRIEVPAG